MVHTTAVAGEPDHARFHVDPAGAAHVQALCRVQMQVALVVVEHGKAAGLMRVAHDGLRV
jgi:hypothetical protein